MALLGHLQPRRGTGRIPLGLSRGTSASRHATHRAGLFAAGFGVHLPGEELGLVEAEVPFEQLQDPYGIAFWPTFKGRDGCRTPMPWTAEANGGFSAAPPWLPVAATHRDRSVARQEAEAGSPLHGFRRFLRWRQQHAVLREGTLHFEHDDPAVLAFTRAHEGIRWWIAFNLSGAPATLEAPALIRAQRIEGHGLPEGVLQGTRLVLPPHGVYFARLA